MTEQFMTEQLKAVRPKPKTATSINNSIDEIIASVTDYPVVISGMNKSDYAYHIYQYIDLVNAPLMVLPAMFNYRFNTDLKDHQEVIDLMKLSELHIGSNETDGYAGTYSRPVAIYMYMTDFWQQALPKLQKHWVISPERLIRLIVDAQHRNNYSAGWSYHLADFFYSEIESYFDLGEGFDISSLVVVEERAYRDAMKIDYPQEFLWLMAINMGLYLNKIRSKAHVERELTACYRNLYQIHKKSADKKIGVALKKNPKSKIESLPVNLTANEMIVLRYKDENDYSKKATQRVIDRLKI